MLSGMSVKRIAGGGAAPVETLVLDTSITSAIHNYKKGQKEVEFEGFDAGADFKGFPSFGSIADGTYDDGNSVARVVTACYDHITSGYPAFGGALWLSITTSPADEDETFTKIIIDGVTRTRSAAAATGIVSGSRWWRWGGTGGLFAGANPDPFELWALV